jgi:hypothetical protein
MPEKSQHPKSSGFWLIGACILGLAGVVAILLIAGKLKTSQHHGAASGISSVPSLVWFLAAVLPLIVHEAGHILAGLSVGFRFWLFNTGPIYIARERPCLDRVSVKFNMNPRRWDFRAGCIPRSYGPNLRTKMLWYTAGGPISSLLGGVLIWPGRVLRMTHKDLFIFLTLFGLVSLVLALYALIPVSTAGSVSDGARILMLVRNGANARRWMALVCLFGMSQTVRPREWLVSLIEMMGDEVDASPDSLWVCFYRYRWHFDLGEREAADKWLDRGMAQLEPNPKPFQAELLWLAARREARRHNGLRARKYLEDAARCSYHEPADLPLIHAGVLISEGRHEEARPYLETAAAGLGASPISLAAMAMEEIAELSSALLLASPQHRNA